MTETIDQLREKIRYHSSLYYNGVPEITDTEFDEMVDRLKTRKPDDEALKEVGALPRYGRKIKHPNFMGSLNKANSFDELEEWFQTKVKSQGEVIISPKIDGLAVRLRYSKGELVEAATRGNGEIGQDVLDNVLTIDDIPDTLSEKWDGEVRGEVYMTISQWKKLAEYSNPRNAASGALLQKDPEITRERRLRFMAHEVHSLEQFNRESEELSYVRNDLSIPTVPFEVIECSTHFKNDFSKWQGFDRQQCDYQIDGLVLAFNSIEVQKEAGWISGRPRGKIAYKFPAQQTQTTVEKIVWQVGRTGKITPVVQVQPVHLDGSNIAQITLHSMSRFLELKIRSGDQVAIEKAGDIIPQVKYLTHRNTNPDEEFEIPDECPECGETVYAEGAHLWCTNPACPVKLNKRLEFWLSSLDVKGIGPKIIANLCQYVDNISEMYSLTQAQWSEIANSDKLGEKLYQELHNKKNIPLWKFICALGLPGVGKKNAQTLAQSYVYVENFSGRNLVEDYKNLEGIGQDTALKISEAMHEWIDEIEDLWRNVLTVKPHQTDSKLQGPLASCSFCITGTLSRKRKDIISDIDYAGGRVMTDVTGGLDYLVCNDTGSNSSKIQKAQNKGIPIISEQELQDMING